MPLWPIVGKSIEESVCALPLQPAFFQNPFHSIATLPLLKISTKNLMLALGPGRAHSANGQVEHRARFGGEVLLPW